MYFLCNRFSVQAAGFADEFSFNNKYLTKSTFSTTLILKGNILCDITHTHFLGSDS